MIKLKEIEERCKKATTGPWQSDIRVGCMAIYAGLPINCLDGIQNRLIRYKHGVPAPTKEAYWTVDDQDVSDNEFIAHARQDIPDLLELVEEAREIILRYKSHAIDVVIIDPQAEVWLGKAGK